MGAGRNSVAVRVSGLAVAEEGPARRRVPHHLVGQRNELVDDMEV